MCFVVNCNGPLGQVVHLGVSSRSNVPLTKSVCVLAVACSACDLVQCHMVKTVQNTCSAIMLVSTVFWILRYDVWSAVTCDLAATTTPQTPPLALFVITVVRMYGQMKLSASIWMLIMFVNTKNIE